MNEDPIKNILKNVGLTEKETDIYIFLAKHGALKGLAIAKMTGTDKASAYRILKSLQNKGLLEVTLESPVRFTAIPFNQVLTSFIKSRRDEVSLIENTKDDLLNDWEKISRTNFELSAEKFVVIEGESKIYPRITQLIKEVKNELSIISPVATLLRANQFSLFDALNDIPKKSKMQLRLVTDFPENNFENLKTLARKAEATTNCTIKTPNLGLIAQPRIIIRDADEALIFIDPKNGDLMKPNGSELCLWTNCKTLVSSFISVFNNLWDCSTEISKKILETQTGKLTPKTIVISNPETAQRAYVQAMQSAKESIVMMTSSRNLIAASKNTSLIKNCLEKGVKVRMMAPIVSENLKAALDLSEFLEVRHVPASYLVTTVVDGQHLFQFKNSPIGEENSQLLSHFENTFYSSDFDFIEKTKMMLDDVWNNAPVPSAATIESLINPTKQKMDVLTKKRFNEYKESLNITHLEIGHSSEKEIINKIINAKPNQRRQVFSKHIDVFYGSSASAIINPPSHFNLPRMIIQVGHFDKSSSFGGHDEVMISLWLDAGNGSVYVPAGQICDNPRVLAHRKKLYAGKPIEKNLRLVSKQDIQIRVHGNTLFAGWTTPIPLFPPPSTLPPCCIVFEGYGDLKTKLMETKQAGRRQVFEANTFDAFVTFYHPSTKYTGPGTDGLLSREIVATTYPL